MVFFEILYLMFSWLPAPLDKIAFGAVCLLLLFVVFKLVCAILDFIPFF